MHFSFFSLIERYPLPAQSQSDLLFYTVYYSGAHLYGLNFSERTAKLASEVATMCEKGIVHAEQYFAKAATAGDAGATFSNQGADTVGTILTRKELAVPYCESFRVDHSQFSNASYVLDNQVWFSDCAVSYPADYVVPTFDNAMCLPAPVHPIQRFPGLASPFAPIIMAVCFVGACAVVVTLVKSVLFSLRKGPLYSLRHKAGPFNVFAEHLWSHERKGKKIVRRGGIPAVNTAVTADTLDNSGLSLDSENDLHTSTDTGNGPSTSSSSDSTVSSEEEGAEDTHGLSSPSVSSASNAMANSDLVTSGEVTPSAGTSLAVPEEPTMSEEAASLTESSETTHITEVNESDDHEVASSVPVSPSAVHTPPLTVPATPSTSAEFRYSGRFDPLLLLEETEELEEDEKASVVSQMPQAPGPWMHPEGKPEEDESGGKWTTTTTRKRKKFLKGVHRQLPISEPTHSDALPRTLVLRGGSRNKPRLQKLGRTGR